MFKTIFLKIINRVEFWIYRIKLSTVNLKNRGISVKISEGFKFVQSENISLGDYVYIGPNSTMYGHSEIRIGKGTIIGPNCTIYSANHNYKENLEYIPYDKKLILKPVAIEENVWIGGNVTILPGVTIGEGVIVGAGSVVTRSIDKYEIIGGNPAKKIGERDIKEYERLKFEDKIYIKYKEKENE